MNKNVMHHVVRLFNGTIKHDGDWPSKLDIEKYNSYTQAVVIKTLPTINKFVADTGTMSLSKICDAMRQNWYKNENGGTHRHAVAITKASLVRRGYSERRANDVVTINMLPEVISFYSGFYYVRDILKK